MNQSVAEKIKEIEIYARKLMSGHLIGTKTSAIKGSGLEFDQIREYQIGDDVRFLDWNSSARMNKLLVKQFYEERNRIIILALDISESSFYGTMQLKYEMISYIAALLALSAELAKDHIGLILFSDEIHTYIPPHKGRKHLRIILEKLFSIEPQKRKTNISSALDYLARLKKKNALVFMISDFIDAGYEGKLPYLSALYDFIAVRINHPFENALPNVGLLTMHDIETGQEIIVKTNQKKVRNFLNDSFENSKKLFQKNKIDVLELSCDEQPLPSIIKFFKGRKK
jgi:uncharacterized protein (DUF58 family)